ncbi:SET domain-containing protein [Coccomyxa subellipsoidea C-169]|uniref:SET domain-containing protein n=1 Tax=Coccomyxa subellipsoidea (strain C-169) TaxID=574566 RepID=I0YT74_COCSC|nr:SET domain-containing protein [Coccomyxa subellipsoidea C-169]EIE21593.1 SET domain-containing protein [Coccomyxa subellipsoidea C-169]|eukprot:XP_005646137.1 SET domain-containing protein [Coccomyxa subellipsoidea C-169]
MLDADFAEWLQKGGALIADIEPGAVAEGFRGVIAKANIEEGTLLVAVPERLLLSAHSAKKDRAFAEALLATNKQSIGSSQVLAAHLLHEASKGQESFWRPYLATLPRQYTCLSYFSPEDIRELQVEYAMDIASSVVEALRSDHTSVKPLLNALATVASRTMYLPDDAAGALMPFGDLHNHRSPPAAATPDLGIPGGAQVPAEAQNDHGSSGSGQFDVGTREYRLYAQTR